MDDNSALLSGRYCYNSYKDLIKFQIYLADYNIPIAYTDNISFSELNFMFDTLNEYIREKNKALSE